MIRLMVVCAGLISGLPADAPLAVDETRRAYDEARSLTGRDAEAQVRLALWCEAHGLQAERLKHLAIAVLTDPANASARGLMGLVEYRGRWTKPDSVAGQVKDDPKLAEALAEYNARREALKNRADDHYTLAVWCEEHGLKPEALAHFTNVVRLDPTREAAWKRLGCKKRNGVWMSDAQFASIQAEHDAQTHADRKWKPLLERYKTALVEKDKSRRADAEAKLFEVNDPRAVASIWAVFATGTAAGQEVAARMFGQIDGPGASRALALLAVRGRSAEVRRVAAETLRRRDPREFVDLVIDFLRKPVKYEVRPVGGPGSPGVLFVEGEKYNVRRFYAQPVTPAVRVPNRMFTAGVPYDPYTSQLASQTSVMNSYFPVASALPGSRSTPDQLLAESTQAAYAQDAAVAQAVQRNIATAIQETAITQQTLANDIRAIEMMNSDIVATNEHAVPVLKEVTDQDFGDDSKRWRKWWTDQKGYALITPDETTRPKPTYDVFVALPIARQTPHNACFAAGSSVRTIEGPRPIESIRVGDQVVVQDTRTGGLRYQPVVTVYHNPPNGTLRVAFEDEAIVATGIHRFWRAGKGWAMVRELKPGDTIRTLGGTATVVSVSEDKVQPVFNLEVADGRSFFVGRTGVLVHDNSLVEATPNPFDALPALAAAGK